MIETKNTVLIWRITYDRVLRGYGAFPAKPLPLRDVWNAVTIYRNVKILKKERLKCGTLMYSEVAAVAEDDGITILPLRIVTYSTRRVF